MKLKQRVGDFRVRELLVDGYLRPHGDVRVYRVTKRKLTSLEAARELARAAGIDAADVGMAGMKDRQAVTVQHMSVPRGPEVKIATPELKIDTVGFAELPFSSEFSEGNAFELVVRELRRSDVHVLRESLPLVREQGLVNYFDDQRFGNVTHEQGWIAKELMLGRHEAALLQLLTARSPYDSPHEASFKQALSERWGDARACRDIAGKHGAHHSIFEHLARSPQDFAGAFTYVASRLRLIHLYAFQSHVWNRAVAARVRELVPLEARAVLDGVEGPLVTWTDARPAELGAEATFRLPGAGLDDVSDPHEARLLRDVLAEHRMVPDQFRIEGVSGFHVKGEDRALVIVPRHLRVRPAEPDVLNRGFSAVRVRFELPRGAYATLVIKRLFAKPHASAERESAPPAAATRRPYAKRREPERDVGFRAEGGEVAPTSPSREQRQPRERYEQRERYEPRERRGERGDRGNQGDRGQRGERGRWSHDERRDFRGGGERDRRQQGGHQQHAGGRERGFDQQREHGGGRYGGSRSERPGGGRRGGDERDGQRARPWNRGGEREQTQRREGEPQRWIPRGDRRSHDQRRTERPAWNDDRRGRSGGEHERPTGDRRDQRGGGYDQRGGGYGQRGGGYGQRGGYDQRGGQERRRGGDWDRGGRAGRTERGGERYGRGGGRKNWRGPRTESGGAERSSEPSRAEPRSEPPVQDTP